MQAHWQACWWPPAEPGKSHLQQTASGTIPAKNDAPTSGVWKSLFLSTLSPWSPKGSMSNENMEAFWTVQTSSG